MAKKKAKKVEKSKYKDCEIEITFYDVEQELSIDKKVVDVLQDADTGAYSSPDLPYQTYGSLTEMAEKIIDSREAQN